MAKSIHACSVNCVFVLHGRPAKQLFCRLPCHGSIPEEALIVLKKKNQGDAGTHHITYAHHPQVLALVHLHEDKGSAFESVTAQ